MNIKKSYLIILTAIIWLSITTANGQTPTRVVANFDSDWKFIQGDVQNASEAGFNDNNWRLLDLPHDWSVEGTINEKEPAGGNGGYFPTGIGWYRKHFIVSREDLKRVNLIVFDGVYMNSDVWLNGKHLGNYPFGYNSFYYTMNQNLKAGDNVVAVRVDNSKQPNSRWYSGSGIYRHVWIVKTNELHIAQWGTYITTPEISDKSASVAVNVRLENASSKVGNAKVSFKIINDKGVEVAQTESPFTIQPGEEKNIDQKVNVIAPKLWTLESPVLYTIITTIIVNGKPVDEVKTPFGIRSIRYDVNKGFFLNDKNIKMNGVCLHHDAGCLGAAVPIKVWERRFQVLKDMGCNAIRCSHNPVAPEFLDLCDRMGFLVMDEVFDEWKIPKRQFAYNIFFDEWSEKDVLAMVRRDRNHPSIVLWSAGNEIPEQASENGTEMYKKLAAIFHKEDPTRPVTVACDNIAADGETG